MARTGRDTKQVFTDLEDDADGVMDGFRGGNGRGAMADLTYRGEPWNFGDNDGGFES